MYGGHCLSLPELVTDNSSFSWLCLEHHTLHRSPARVSPKGKQQTRLLYSLLSEEAPLATTGQMGIVETLSAPRASAPSQDPWALFSLSTEGCGISHSITKVSSKSQDETSPGEEREALSKQVPSRGLRRNS